MNWTRSTGIALSIIGVRVDWASCKSDKLCWYYNSHNLRGSNLRSKVSGGRVKCLTHTTS